MRKILGLTLLMAGIAINCLAGARPAPEVDSTTVGAAAALLAGGLLIIRYRRKK